jgi:hypothetical protein
VNKKFLFWLVLVIWVIIVGGTYTTAILNIQPFHDESRITYTTDGMTKEQVNGLYEYINSLKDYSLPTFIPSPNDMTLFHLDNGNNTYTVELYIDNYEQYGLIIKQREQRLDVIVTGAFAGGFLLVFGGFLGIMPLYQYAYNKSEVK